jgi:hypothetical protein
VFCVSAPSEDQIRRFISDQRGAEISYTVVGRSAPQTSSLRHCERRLSALALPPKNNSLRVQSVVGESKKLGDD